MVGNSGVLFFGSVMHKIFRAPCSKASCASVVEPVLKAHEVRDEILRQIAEQQMDRRKPGRWPEEHQALRFWAPPIRTMTTIAGSYQSAGERARGQLRRQESATERVDRQLGVHRVFANAGRPVTPKGYQSNRAGRNATQLLSWQDPRKNPLGDNARSDAWAKVLANFDCVVLLRDHADYDVDFIRQHAKSVVDARRHGFDPARDATAKQQGKPTLGHLHGAGSGDQSSRG